MEPVDVLAEDCGGGYVDVNVFDKGPVNRLVGSIRIELDPLQDRKSNRQWYTLEPHIPEEVDDEASVAEVTEGGTKMSKANVRKAKAAAIKKRMAAQRAKDARAKAAKERSKREPTKPVMRVELALRLVP